MEPRSMLSVKWDHATSAYEVAACFVQQERFDPLRVGPASEIFCSNVRSVQIPCEFSMLTIRRSAMVMRSARVLRAIKKGRGGLWRGPDAYLYIFISICWLLFGSLGQGDAAAGMACGKQKRRIGDPNYGTTLAAPTSSARRMPQHSHLNPKRGACF